MAVAIPTVQPINLSPGILVLPVEEVNRVVREVNVALDAISVALNAVAPSVAPPSVADLRDATGGTASDTLASPADDAARNGLASLARKVNALLIACRNARIIR